MQKDLYRLLSDDFQIKKTTGDELRQFNGVANSGRPFDYYGMPTVVDFAELSHNEKTPVLFVHDRKCETGHGKLSVQNNELTISGVLLTSEWGNKVAKAYDEDFPWQLSVDVRASKLDELAHGETAVVNGNEIVGPLVIMRKCSIVEVSFTPTGVDDQTHATVLSDDGTNTPHPNPPPKGDGLNKETTMTLEEALAKIETLEADKKAMQQEIDELKADTKKANLDAELSQAGFSKDDAGNWQGISQSTISLLLSANESDVKATIADLANTQKNDSKPNLPSALLGEQYKGHDDGNNAQGVKLSDNPLVANAMARGAGNGGYI